MNRLIKIMIIELGFLSILYACNNQQIKESSINDFDENTNVTNYYNPQSIEQEEEVYLDSTNETDYYVPQDYEYDSIGISFFVNTDSIGRMNYKHILDSFSLIYNNNNKLEIEEIETIMPKTRREYNIYYKMYCSKNHNLQKQPFLHYADSLIGCYAYRDSLNCFYIRLNMFYMLGNDDIYNLIDDDYYRENLFYDVDFSTERNQLKFKKLYYSFDRKMQKEFECFLWE